MTIVWKSEYKNGDGFAVSVGKAPKKAMPADVIALHTAQRGKGTSQHYTPDEAMAVAMGLISGVDAVLQMKFYNEFRKNPVIVKPRKIGWTRSKENAAYHDDMVDAMRYVFESEKWRRLWDSLPWYQKVWKRVKGWFNKSK